ncbi:TctC [Comamonas thiooxydans]|nr:TctC [Comamonas thiooxydans]
MAAVVAAPLTQALAQGGNWPAKPITFVVPQAPGGANDVIARAVAQGLENSLGQPVIVENRAGANGNLGTGQVARSAADGYTFLVTAQSAYTINPALYSRVPFDPIKDFTPVMQLAVAPYLLVVNPNFPAKNLDELVAYAKAHPGKVEYASAGNGTLNHLLGEMLKKQKNVSLLHVPYKGGVGCRHRCGGRPVAGDLWQLSRCDAFCQQRQAARAGRGVRQADLAGARDTRAGQGPGRDQLVRLVRTGRYAAAGGGQALSGRQDRAGQARDGRAPQDSGRRARGVHAAKLQGHAAGRAGVLEAGGQGLRRAYRLKGTTAC